MHDGVWFYPEQSSSDLLAIVQIALDELRPRINRPPMALGEVIENRDLVAFIDEQFRADAADITGTADDEDSHRRKWDVRTRPVKRNNRGLQSSLHRGERRLLFFQARDHPPDPPDSAPLAQDLQTILI